MSASAAIWHPARAWAIAASYLLLSVLLSWLAGTLALVLDAPPPQGMREWMLAAVCSVVVAVGYGVLWPRGSFTDGRQVHGLCWLFGLGWGLAQGLMFLNLWRLVAAAGWPAAVTLALGFVVIAIYAALFQSLFWDRQVSPPHNYIEWNLRKVAYCHTPNLVCTLSYLQFTGGASAFVLWQMLALVLSAHALRMPPPWSPYRATAGAQRSLRSAVRPRV